MQETAKECFKRLIRSSRSSKFKEMLESIRVACDEIEKFGGIINHRRIAEYTTNHFGAPSLSAISQNPNHKFYIAIRQHEYEQKHMPPSVAKESHQHQLDDYPKDINALRHWLAIANGEIATLRKINEKLRTKFAEYTNENPINYGQSIAQGPRQDGSLQIVGRNRQTKLSDKAVMAVHKLLNLGNNPATALKYATHEGKRIMELNSPSFKEIILFSDELMELEECLKANKDSNAPKHHK